jgi:hypothetical protein
MDWTSNSAKITEKYAVEICGRPPRVYRSLYAKHAKNRETQTETLTRGRRRTGQTPADLKRQQFRRKKTGRMPLDIRPVALNLRVLGSIPRRLTTSSKEFSISSR